MKICAPVLVEISKLAIAYKSSLLCNWQQDIWWVASVVSIVYAIPGLTGIPSQWIGQETEHLIFTRQVGIRLKDASERNVDSKTAEPVALSVQKNMRRRIL